MSVSRFLPFAPPSGALIAGLTHTHHPLWQDYQFLAANYAPYLPHIGTCAGKSYAAVVGCACLSSYLLLFIAFYQKTYKTTQQKKNSHKAKIAAANGNGKHVTGVNEKITNGKVSADQ